ncbi:MAG: sugar ABC transporter permease [Clostridiales bacterium]|nr:sugar ABC transporter permease [Clostridiales bacterium]
MIEKFWQKCLPYIFVAPAMVFMAVFTLYPLGNMIYLSMTDWVLMSKTKNFVGLDNFIYIAQRADFLNALGNTFFYTFWTVLTLMVAALVFAVLLYKNTRLNNLVRTAMFTPHVIALLSVSMIWSWLMNEDSGLLNMLLSAVGLPTSRWLNSSDTAMASLVLVSWWKSVGYYTLIIFAALQGIPAEIYEAAELDNAGALNRFLRITLPMISPQVFLCLITMTIGSFKVFETIRVMTAGGPGKSTQVLVYYIYNTAFGMQFKIGVASAAGVVLLVIVGLLTMLYFLVLSKRVHYQ